MPSADSSIAGEKTRKPSKLETDSASQNLRATWLAAFRKVRAETEHRASFLSPEDQVIQSMPDASPAKWHRAHTTWFFEQFLLGQHCHGYVPYHPDYAFLFNSYYVSAGPRHARGERGLLTRPRADEVTAYRKHVDAAVVKFFHEAEETTLAGLVPLLEAAIADLEGNAEGVIKGYRTAIERGERRPDVVRCVVQMLYERRRFVEADQIIRRLPEQAPVSGELVKLAAEISLRRQDAQRALELAQSAVAAESPDSRDHVWVGQVLWAVGRHDEAERHLRRAVALAEDRPEPWVALVQFLASHK